MQSQILLMGFHVIVLEAQEQAVGMALTRVFILVFANVKQVMAFTHVSLRSVCLKKEPTLILESKKFSG